MLKRLRASLANPSSIPQYKNDNIFLVLLYMFVLCFIAALPVLVYSVKKSGVNSQTKYEIRELLTENRDDVIKGEIENNTLTITNEVEEIGKEAFKNCTNLTTVTIERPTYIYTIGENCFYNCLKLVFNALCFIISIPFSISLLIYIFELLV